MTVTYLPPRRGISQSQAYAEAVAYGVSGDPALITLAIYGDDIRDPDTNEPVAIYMVNDYEPLTATLEADAPLDPGATVVFTAAPMRLVMPEESAAQRLPELQLEISGASREATPYLRAAAASRKPVTIIARTYMASDTSAPHESPPLRMALRSATVNGTTVRISAGFGDMVNVPFPQIRYTVEEFPTLGAG